MRPQHRKFAAEYIKNGGNGVQAVFAAGYVQGYFAAGVTAHRLLKSAKIKSMIDAITDDAVADAELTEKRVKKEIARIAFAQIKEVDSSAKMKGLDLATKVLGMQTTKIETSSPDDPISSILIDKIKSCSLKTGQSINDSAINLFKTLEDWGSSHAKPENFGEFQPIIEAYLADKANQVSEIAQISDAEQ